MWTNPVNGAVEADVSVYSPPGHLSLTTGTRLGPHEIVTPIGAGGMGEVYRATDSNLKRSVVIMSNFFDYLRQIAPVKK